MFVLFPMIPPWWPDFQIFDFKFGFYAPNPPRGHLMRSGIGRFGPKRRKSVYLF